PLPRLLDHGRNPLASLLDGRSDLLFCLFEHRLDPFLCRLGVRLDLFGHRREAFALLTASHTIRLLSSDAMSAIRPFPLASRSCPAAPGCASRAPPYRGEIDANVLRHTANAGGSVVRSHPTLSHVVIIAGDWVVGSGFAHAT